MNPQVKAKPDDTRARIMETAEALFRRLGFAKTAVADIAAELRMSPANVYRFFPSKNAIVEAICRRCLTEVEEKAWAAARSKGPAAARMERLFLEILAYHKENLLIEQRVNEIVVFAMENMWDTIRAHKDVTHNVVEADHPRRHRRRRVRAGRSAGDCGIDVCAPRSRSATRCWSANASNRGMTSKPRPAPLSASCCAPLPPAGDPMTDRREGFIVSEL